MDSSLELILNRAKREMFDVAEGDPSLVDPKVQSGFRQGVEATVAHIRILIEQEQQKR